MEKLAAEINRFYQLRYRVCALRASEEWNRDESKAKATGEPNAMQSDHDKLQF